MKPITPLIAVLAVLLLAPLARAQELHRNAYGMYAAPTIFGAAKGSEYDLAGNGAGLDLGGYYSRFFTQSFSARLEARYGKRTMEAPTLNIRLSEIILEIPLVLQADRRIPISDHSLRVSVGGGLSYKFVLDQKLLVPDGDLDQYYPPAEYQKLGLLVDGGVTFAVDRKSAVFARLRFDVDVATMGEPADADVIRRFWATGFYAGFEYEF
jgi:hypothetical protein